MPHSRVTSGTDAPAALPRRRRLSLSPVAAVAITLVILLVGVGIGLYLTRSYAADTRIELDASAAELAAIRRAHEQLQDRNFLLFSRVEALEGQLAAVETTASGLDEGSSAGSFTDGTYRVGEQIDAGTYRGVVTGESGYWARLKSMTGTLSSIIANDIPRGDFTLTIYPSDAAVELRGVVLTGPE